MNYKTILLEKKTDYAIVKLNRPNEMNAISKEMHHELMEVLTRLEDDSDIKAIIITGGEYVFSAGMDIKEIVVIPDAEINEYFESVFMYLKKIYLLKKPVIAAVGGLALGGGFNLVVLCDLVVASESAIFCHPELKYGLNPLFYPLSQIVGLSKAKEIVMLGEPIGANEAMKIGLVNKVAPPDKFMEEAENIAAALSKRSSKAFNEIKKLSRMVPKMEYLAALEIELTTSAKLFARDERKFQMNEVLFLEKLRRKKQD